MGPVPRSQTAMARYLLSCTLGVISFHLALTQDQWTGGDPATGDGAWLESGRCGEDNPSGYWDAGACDPFAWANEKGPCCSDWGWCGHTPAHCDCYECVNYKEILEEAGATSLSALYPSAAVYKLFKTHGGGGSGSWNRARNSFAYRRPRG